jgi:hypothetical protein
MEARQSASIGARVFYPTEPEAQRLGSKPLWSLRDAQGRRFVLKLADPALLAAEQAAYELRRLARRPAVPARIVEIDVEGFGRVQGLLKPFLEFDPARELPSDTRTWSELQRRVLLLEHAWEWFLDNLDTNTSQYALLGEEGYPLNIDWDRSFALDGGSPLDRFAKYRATLPNARTFLYADYVEGRIGLKFRLLEREAQRIRRLPREQVRRIVEPLARARHADPERVEELVRRTLLRQANIEHEVRFFIHSLKQERRQLAVARRLKVKDRLRGIARLAWKRWQVALDAAARGPIGSAGRHLVKLSRSRAVYAAWLSSRLGKGAQVRFPS